MEIGAVGFSPYVYRVNAVSASSLSRVSPIGDDLLASKTDFTGLVEDEKVTITPLKRGETANFADVLAMQFQMGRMNAQRMDLIPEKTDDSIEKKIGQDDIQQAGASLYQTMRAAKAYGAGQIA